MEKYQGVEANILEEMLVSCKDYRERQNIRQALREIKGHKLESNDPYPTQRVGGRTYDTSLTSQHKPWTHSAIHSHSNRKNHNTSVIDTDRHSKREWNLERDSKTSNDFNGNDNVITSIDDISRKDKDKYRERYKKADDNSVENENRTPQYKSYLFAGTLSSPKHSPRDKKVSQSPRRVHTAITRLKDVDKSDLVDKSTETEEGELDTQTTTTTSTETSISKPKCQKVFTSSHRLDTFHPFDSSTPFQKSRNKENKCEAELTDSAIEFSADLEKVSQNTVLHRPVSVNSLSVSCDNSKSTLNHTSPPISSPRKPKKIVSYRTSAFSSINKLSPVSSTVSRVRLQSAPPTVNELPNNDCLHSKTKAAVSKFEGDTVNHTDKQLIDNSRDTSGKHRAFGKCDNEDTEKGGINKEETITHVHDNIYTAKPIEIRRETSNSAVEKIKSKLESNKIDTERDLLDFNYFTNKMKQKHDKRQNGSEKVILLSPVSNESIGQLTEKKASPRGHSVTSHTGSNTMSTYGSVQNVLQKKKTGITRKNRIDSDERRHYQKYRKDFKDSEFGVKSSLNSSSEINTAEVTPRSGDKSRTVRRKLPEIPAKQENEIEDDETVHQRTIRLLQERRNERREKMMFEKGKGKESVEKADKKADKKSEKSKQSPADLRKTLEQKLERSDSKRKAYRVRRELQLLNRENELKSATGNKTDTESDKTDHEISEITESIINKTEKTGNGKVIQRSKSDTVRNRAVSETNVLIDEIDGDDTENRVLKMFEVEKPLTPMGKIELIGTLMQEEAKLQELLRKSTNFNEKRKMRTEVRLLRQKRLAIEDKDDHQRPPPLQRSASVTAGVVTHAIAGVITHARPVYITPPSTEESSQKSQPSIETLRKKLSETQDYDEKKKIRLALRQLRQRTREGATTSLQRSHSSIQLSSSPPVTNGTHNDTDTHTVLRSHSVIGNSVNSNATPVENKERVRADKAFDQCTLPEKEIIKCSDSSLVEGRRKSPVHSKRQADTKQKALQNKPKDNPRTNFSSRHSSFRDDPGERIKSDRNYDISSDLLKHSDRTTPVRDENSNKTEPDSIGKNKGSGIKQSSETVNNIGKPPSSKRNSTESLKGKISRQDSLKAKFIQEKCEVFEQANRLESGDKRTEESVSERVKHKTPQILVSRAHVERNKQNKLISVRRNRSSSAPPVDTRYSNRTQPEENTDNSNQPSEKNTYNSYQPRSASEKNTDTSYQPRPTREKITDNSYQPNSEKNASSDQPTNEKLTFNSDQSSSKKKTYTSDQPTTEENTYKSYKPSNEKRTYNSDQPREKSTNNSNQLSDENKSKSYQPSDKKSYNSTKQKEKHTEETAEKVEKHKHVKKVVNKSLNQESDHKERENKSTNRDSLSNSEPKNDIDDRISPSLLWLEEKRKSFPLSSDIDKLMSTMDIEAAFSEILGAVEEFPDLSNTVDSQAGEIPIVEEVSQEGMELEHEVKTSTGSENESDINQETTSQDNESLESDKTESETNDIANEEKDNVDGNTVTEVSLENEAEVKPQLNSKLSLDVSSRPSTNGAISVLHGDDGTVTVQEMSRVQEGDTTITEWKKLRRTQSKTETRETDTVIEKKITSPGGSASVYEKDISKTRHKLTSRGSNYFTRNNYNIKRKKDLDGAEIVEHDLSSVSENISVSKNETWGDKSEAKLIVNNDSKSDSPFKLKSTEHIADESEKLQTENRSILPSTDSHSISLSTLTEHLGKPTGSPEVKVVLREVTVDEGDSAVLECRVVSSPDPEISWYRDGVRLTENDSEVTSSYDPISGRASLTLQTVAVKHGGEYECVFENSLGTASTKGKLCIKRRCTGPPSFLTNLVDVSVCDGQSLCLECQVCDTDTVTWFKDGVLQRNSPDFKQSFSGCVARLEVDEIYLDDCGVYSCVLKNVSGEKKCSCTVNVTESKSTDEVFPVFLKKPETTIANEGDPVIIDCEVIGSPTPGISWLRDGSKVIEDRCHRMSYDGRVAMLVVRRVKVEESGKIECVAENAAGTVSSECHLIIKAQKSAPLVKEPLSDVTVTCGEKVTLRCMITGEPKPEISWRKNGLVIGHTLDFKQMYQDHVAILEIGNTCLKDGGCYECEGSNEKGKVTTSCQLNITDDSTVPKDDTPVEMTQAKVAVHEQPAEMARVNVTPVTTQPDNGQQHIAKSQASKIMLVRQGSLRSMRSEKPESPSLVRSGSLQSIHRTSKFDDLNNNSGKSDKVKVYEDNAIKGVDKESSGNDRVDMNENDKTLESANITAPDKAKVVADKNEEKPSSNRKTVKTGAFVGSFCFDDSSEKEFKPVAKFKAGGELRRTQSVKTVGSEKPEWLQLKLRKVGNNRPSPLAMESKPSQTFNKNSGTVDTVTNDTPVSVQKDIRLSRSQSSAAVDRSLALKDSTNSPANQPNKDSLKLMSVSERAKMFQTKESGSSGKSSPIEIISKAIHLSRTESLRSAGENRPSGLRRSQSFRTETPAAGDVTLELTPQKPQEQESKSEQGSSKEIKYWDPTAPSLTKMDYSTITDEEQLNQMLSKSDNFDERKKIRARIKEVRDQHMKDWAAKSAARKTDYEDPIKRKHREADLMKQQKLKQFEKQAAEHHESKHLDMAEQQLRERVRIADEQKNRTMKEYAERGATHQESLHLEVSERALQEKIKQADILKKKTLDAYDQAAGKSTGMSQTSTVNTEISRDGNSVTTTRKVQTVTKVGGATGKPAEELAPQLVQKILTAAPSVGGVLTVKTESWSSKDNVTHTSEKTQSWGGRGGAMNAFKAMDAKNAPKTNLAPGAGRGANITRSPSAIKTMLLEWCKAMTREYVDIIEITNFSTSWNNGLAFCALIHHFYPDAFDMKSLDPKQRRKNFELAFDTAENLADIAPLLDVEDMVRMQKPDWKCVFTYVQSFYRKLNSHERNKAMA